MTHLGIWLLQRLQKAMETEFLHSRFKTPVKRWGGFPHERYFHNSCQFMIDVHMYVLLYHRGWVLRNKRLLIDLRKSLSSCQEVLLEWQLWLKNPWTWQTHVPGSSCLKYCWNSNNTFSFYRSWTSYCAETKPTLDWETYPVYKCNDASKFVAEALLYTVVGI